MIKIIGAGIGGLTAAITIATRRPDEVGYFEIYEKYGNSHSLGGTITLFPNAIRVLKELECLEDLYESGWIVDNAKFLNSKLEIVVNREIGNILRYGENTVAIRRNSLQEILLKKLRSLGKDVVFNSNYKIDHNHDFLNETRLLIADGSGSPNRLLIDPKFNREFQGIIYYGGYINCNNEFLNKIRKTFYLENFNQTIILNNSSFIGISAFKNEKNKIGLHWYTYINAKKSLEKSIIEKMRSEIDCSSVLLTHSNLNSLITEMILKTNDLVVSNIYETVPNNNCISRNFLFIGDAAHNINPLSGQGAGMAIEDAFIYSLIMSRNNRENIDIDLKKIYQERKKRVLKIQSKSRRSSKLSRVSFSNHIINIRNKIFMLLNIIIPNKLKNYTFYYNCYDELKKLGIKL